MSFQTPPLSLCDHYDLADKCLWLVSADAADRCATVSVAHVPSAQQMCLAALAGLRAVLEG